MSLTTDINDPKVLELFESNGRALDEIRSICKQWQASRNLAVNIDGWQPYVIVLQVLKAYAERNAGLPDWWVWTHFLACAGRHEGRLDTWQAERLFEHLLTGFRAIAAYNAKGWLWRLLHRWMYRAALRELLFTGDELVAGDDKWCDRFEFADYKRQHGVE